MKKINQDEWLFFALSLIGIVSLVGMGFYNLSLGNDLIGRFELGVALIGTVNGVIFWKLRRLDIATHIVLSMMLFLLAVVLWRGGLYELGWLWIFTYPPLAFALKTVKSASWYVGGLGGVILLTTITELTGWDTTVYGGNGLIQLCLSYMVVSLMVLMGEKAHEKTEQAYLMQGNEIEYEKRLLEVRANELRMFKTAVEQSSELMLFTDPEGIVLWANEATERVTGFKVVEAVGKKAGLLWGKMMDQDYYEELWRVIKQEKQIFSGEIQNHRKNMEHFYSTITIYPLLDERGEVVHFVATQRDITAQKEIDQMKTDFVTLVSHQLRTPLSSMRWNLEMLLAKDVGKLSAKQQSVVGDIEKSNLRMIKLVTTLLNISRIESGRLIITSEKLDLNKFVQTAIEELSTDFESKKQIVKYKGVTTGKVAIDQQLMRQVIQNLLHNARKYSADGAKIDVRLSKQTDFWKIEVEDKGCGVPRHEQRKIFGKYFRASNAVKHEADGTGMGLYLNHLILKMMGGSIGFESVEGKGSTFWFTIPIKGIAAKAGEVRLS